MKPGIVLLLILLNIATSAIGQIGTRYPSEKKVVKDPVTGTELVFLTSKPYGDSKIYQTHPQWTSDGNWVIFRSNRVRGEAMAVNEKTGAIVQVTEGGYTGMLNLSRKTMKLYLMRVEGTYERGSPRSFNIIETDLATLFADSESGNLRPASYYERICGNIPAKIGAAGDMALDAAEDRIYFRTGRDEAARYLAPATEIAAPFGSRNMGAGPSGIGSMGLGTGEYNHIVSLPFQVGHIQTNPWVPGEIVFCWETGGKAPQRTWTVNSDGSGLRPLYPESEYEWVTHEAIITKDEVAIAIMGHRPVALTDGVGQPAAESGQANPGQEPGWGPSGTREKPTGLGIVNLRTREMILAGQTDSGSGLWHIHGSPDGRFAVGDDFSRSIYLIDRRTKEMIMLSTGHKTTAADHPHPSFSPCGTKIHIQSAMLSDDNRTMNICIIPVPESFTNLTLSSFTCQKNHGSRDNDLLELTIEADASHQTIHSFGASDAWSCQFIGKNWPAEKREQIADWLFSTGMDEDNNPMGIGLTAWRFNIGGGSAFQGNDSKINDEWRRSESFMTGINKFDWSMQQGQRWFLQAAQKRGVDQFTGFVNSPPVFLTKNGMGFSSDESRFNLPEENYRLYADFLGRVVGNLKKNDGISLTYVSPFNEPQWDWTNPTQEGTPAQNSEIAAVVRILNEVFENRNIASLIEIPETAQFDYLYEDGNRPGRGSQIDAFFNPSSPHYVGSLPHVAQKVAGHSYFTSWPLDRQAETRQKVRKAIEASPRPIEFWMTEYCVLENNPVIRGNGRDRSMHTALYVARVIWSDLVLANASTWQWWLGVSPYDYKDGLVYTDYNKYDGEIYDSKLLWIMGNFSRFVRPGMKRVSVSRNDGKTVEMMMEDVMATAFITPDSQRITVVIINTGEEQKEIGLSLKGLEGIGELSKYITDSSPYGNLKYTGGYTPGDLLVVPGHSVSTITNQQ